MPPDLSHPEPVFLRRRTGHRGVTGLLRRRYLCRGDGSLVAMLIVVIIAAVGFSIPTLLKLATPEQKEVMTEVTTLSKLAEPEIKQEEMKRVEPVAPPPPALKSSIKFTAPVIKKDEEVHEDNEIKSQEDKPVITVDNKEMFTNLASKEDSILLKYKATNTNGPRDLTIDIDKNDQDWISFKPAIDAKGDSTFLVSVKENTGGERTATIALCAAADKKVREEFIVTQAQASDVELVITNKNDFRTSLDKLGSAATVKYSVQSTLTDPKNEILVDIVYPEESGYTAENGWLHMANNSMPERVIFTYDVNKVLRERQATVYIYRKGYENKKDYMVIRQAAATQIEIPAPGGLTNVLQSLIDDEIYKDWESITSLELKGRLNDTDLNLLKNMMTAGKGYNLKTLDMTEVENETLKNGVFNGCNLLENISFPTGLQYVPREACRNCTKLRTVVVNEGPTYIGRHAFGNSVVNEAWFPSTMTYVYGYIFDNVTALKTLHLKSLPFQCKEVARSDADEGATQPTTWCTVFKTWPSTVYVPMEYLEYYKNPDPKHVVSMHFQDLLNTLTSESEEWTKGPKVQQPYLKSNSALKSNFTWGSSATTIMGESN